MRRRAGPAGPGAGQDRAVASGGFPFSPRCHARAGGPPGRDGPDAAGLGTVGSGGSRGSGVGGTVGPAVLGAAGLGERWVQWFSAQRAGASGLDGNGLGAARRVQRAQTGPSGRDGPGAAGLSGPGLSGCRAHEAGTTVRERQVRARPRGPTHRRGCTGTPALCSPQRARRRGIALRRGGRPVRRARSRLRQRNTDSWI